MAHKDKEKTRAREKAWRLANKKRINENARKRYWANLGKSREKSREKSRKRRLANPEKSIENQRKWRLANPEKARAREKAWRLANKEKIRAQDRARYWANPEKARARKKAWSQAHPEKVRATNLKREYGITPEIFEEMYLGQNGKCKNCGDPISRRNLKDGTKYANIDHNHATGKVRGLVCTQCNLKIGHVEKIEQLEKARQYLKEAEAVCVG